MCRLVVAKILNMFKNFMRQNSSQIGRKVIAGVSNPSPTPRNLVVIILEHDIFARQIKLNCDIIETLRDHIASKGPRTVLMKDCP